MSSERSWSAGKPMMIGLAAMVMLVGGVGTWSTQVEIAGAVLGSGRLEVDSTKQVIQHPTGGAIAEILAENGDDVAAGEVVLRLDGFTLRTELNTVEGELVEMLAKEARLKAVIDDRPALETPPELVARRDGDPAVRETLARHARLLQAAYEEETRKSGLLVQKMAQIESQIRAVDSQRVATEVQLDLVDEDIANSERMLAQHLIKAVHLNDLKQERARHLGEAGELDAKRAELVEKSIELELDLLALPIDRRDAAVEELGKLQPAKIKLVETRADLLSRLEQLEVRSPVAGRIHDSQVAGLRSVVMEGRPIMSVVPADRPAFAVVRIDASDIEQVHYGQEVMLRFSAFNRRATPLVPGRVFALSADAFTDATTRATYYEAQVSFLAEDLAALIGAEVVPGMPVEAYFSTEKQTPLAYVLRPIVDYFNRAYRDT